MHFSEPAPRRGGMGQNYFLSPRSGASPNCSGSGSKSPSKSPASKKPAPHMPLAPNTSPARRRGGMAGSVGGRGAGKQEVRQQARGGGSGGRGGGRGSKKGKKCDSDEDVPKLEGRPEKWSIAQHDLSICQWSGFGWAQCDKCNKWRKPSVSGVGNAQKI